MFAFNLIENIIFNGVKWMPIIFIHMQDVN